MLLECNGKVYEITNEMKKKKEKKKILRTRRK